MPGFDGTGPNGMGPMTGGGRGYCVLPISTPEQELELLKGQVEALKDKLNEIEAGIGNLSAKKSKEQ